MNLSMMQLAIKSTLDLYPKGIEKIQFFGGESLLNFKLIEEGVCWIEKYFEEVAKKSITSLFQQFIKGYADF